MLKVALVGLGAIGAGVLDLLGREPGVQVIGVLVRESGLA